MLTLGQGNERWITQLEHKFHKELQASSFKPWVVPGFSRIAGDVRSAGGGEFGAGNVNFVNVRESGCVSISAHILRHLSYNANSHMVPYDLPEAALVSPM